jgi:hypothetical protein
MNYGLEDFIEEAIQLELNAADLYALFSEVIPEDADFWAGLSWEERNHASLLKTARDVLLPVEQFPGEILPDFIQSLVDTNTWLNSLRDEFAKEPPGRKSAFVIALKIENSAGEKHFQRVMESPSESKFVKVFQELCKDDIHHHDRIKKYMADVGELVETGGNRNRRILIAVDDESVANLLNLIISAIEMPIVDGLKFFSEAKAISPELNKRFLFFTGAPTSDRLTFFRDENIRYLVKPSTINEIRATVLNMLA